ncbi:CPBP family intramembrane glutamic endopeptidase [Pseudoroseicyclus sp. CXY001]|uniref:CPBP family intramembrane glutamic endopeptidase n=1 Tax=Pseudoroseicyclus sp. CXY001 TaxID=3242492 RepID=UPI0035711958
MARPDPYAPLAAFAAPAGGSSLSAVLGGLLAVAAAYIGGQILVFGLLLPFQGPEQGAPLSRLGVLLFLLSYLAPLAMVVTWCRRVLGRPAAGLLGPAVRLWQHWLRAFLWVFGLMLVLLALPSWTLELVRLNPVAPWLLTLPVMLPAVLLQTATEEVVFRGYLQQELAARSKSPLVWMVLPSVAFGALHWGNGSSPADRLLYVGVISIYGMLSADLVARTGSLGASIAFHFAVNIQSILLFGEEGLGLERAALGVLPPQDIELGGMTMGDMLGPAGLVILAVSSVPFLLYWLAARVAVRR